MSDLQLPSRVPQSGEQVQLDAGLSAQVALQVLSFILHRRQGGQQQLRVLLHAAVRPQGLEEGGGWAGLVDTDSESEREWKDKVGGGKGKERGKREKGGDRG